MSVNSNDILSKSFHYNFEPFFTIQPNIETRKQQLKAWRQLIVDYYESINEHLLDINQSTNDPIFKNNKISRQLSKDSIRLILDDLQTNGLIEWMDKKQEKCYVYWKRPEEWAQLIYKWVADKSLHNTVCTFYEIIGSDDTIGLPFHGLNEDILIKSLKCLENEGKAVLIDFDNNSGPFGQTFISDDFFLSAVGASAAVCNTVCRILVGHLKDMTTYKICCIPLSCLATILVVTLPFTLYAHRMVYAICVVMAVGIVGSQYALMPSAITEAFGEKYASINIGLVYMSTVIADIAGAFASQLLTDTLGWSGMIAMVGACALIDFLITFLLPNNQRLKLKKRLVGQQNIKTNETKNSDDFRFGANIYFNNNNTINGVMPTRRTSISKPSLFKTCDSIPEATRL